MPCRKNKKPFYLFIINAHLMYKYILTAALGLPGLLLYAQPKPATANTQIDNMGYWKKMIREGKAKPNPVVAVLPAIFTGSQLNSRALIINDSPDILINNTAGNTQSENSVAINPANRLRALNSNNSSNGATFLGTSSFTTTNQGATWAGSINGAGGNNSGDPAAVISNNNRYYIGLIDNTLGQSIAISTNEGATWTTSTVAPVGTSFVLDKNHLWVDKAATSPHQHNLYAAWTDFSGPNNQRIVFTRSTNGGLNWSTGINISQASAGAGQDQGVNIASGPAGEVYAVWTIYQNWPGDESAIGFASSANGGVSFSPAVRIIDNIRGIRITGAGKNMRVNSYPVMAVDNSYSPYRGSIYVVWANIGTPGTNTGNDVDIYMITSRNNGATWSAPQLVNTKVNGQGKKHFFPWITCDQATGKLHIIYYDDRNTTATNCETWMSSSFDGGSTWTDYKVSDVSFTPSPIPGLATGYFGDYLGLSAQDDVLYPVWTDNRSGAARAYTSPLVANDFCAVNMNLQNITMPLDAVFRYRASTAIAAAGSSTTFVMQGNGVTGAQASMVAGADITLLPGTDIQAGASLTIIPGPCTSPILRQGPASESFARLNLQQQEFEPNSNLNTYPNPVEDKLYLELSPVWAQKRNLTYILTDLMANPIQRGIINQNPLTIPTNQLPAGGYFLAVYENEKLLETKRIIKQ
jgi:hypothetical protein